MLSAKNPSVAVPLILERPLSVRNGATISLAVALVTAKGWEGDRGGPPSLSGRTCRKRQLNSNLHLPVVQKSRQAPGGRAGLLLVRRVVDELDGL